MVVVAAALVAAWACPPASAAARYRVRPGDSLTAIAARFHTSVSVLARLNKLDPDRVLVIGTRLRLPAPPAGRQLTPYVVRPGDTLSHIAFGHGLTVAEVARLNGLDPNGVLLAGRRLLLPGGPSKQAIRESIRRWADHYGIPRSLALALAWQESGHQAHVVSAAGAVGVMQVMPGTWRYVEVNLIGRRVPHTAEGNVHVGLAYLRHLLNTFGNTQLALAAYLQGEHSVRAEGIYRSSRRYVANILAIAARLCDQTV